MAIINDKIKPKSVFDIVEETIRDKLNLDKDVKITSNSTLTDLGADSLDDVELVMRLEKIFGIAIPDDATERLKTVGDLVKCIEDAKNPTPTTLPAKTNATKKQPKSFVEPKPVFDIVKEIVTKTLNVRQDQHTTPTITLNSQLRNDLDIDSLDTMTIIADIEKHFGIAIPDDATECLKTVGDLVKYIEDAKNPKPATLPAKTSVTKEQPKSFVEPKTVDWDEIFLITAYSIAYASHCVSHQVCALIVKDKRIISTGINGTPAGCPNCDEIFPQKPKNGENTGFNRTEHHAFSLANEIHAEMNAINYAANNGTSINGTTLYCTTQPCGECLKNILQTGISRIVYAESYDLANYSDFIKDAIKTKNIEFVHKPVRPDSKCLQFINKSVQQKHR